MATQDVKDAINNIDYLSKTLSEDKGAKLREEKCQTTSQYDVYMNDCEKYPNEKYALELNGFNCELVRHTDFGVWNGYVELPITHNLYGIHCGLSREITFTHMYPDRKFVIGFDHCRYCKGGDYSPLKPNTGSKFATYEQVVKELKKLTKELKSGLSKSLGKKQETEILKKQILGVREDFSFGDTLLNKKQRKQKRKKQNRERCQLMKKWNID